MPQTHPILSAPADAPALTLGNTMLLHRIRSEQTNGDLSVVEFVSPPGEGVGMHLHQNEDELVYLLEGQIEVTLGEQTMTTPKGACALLPRGIAHGYVNTGDRESRLLAILLPGSLDGFFIRLDELLATEGPHEDSIEALCNVYGITFT